MSNLMNKIKDAVTGDSHRDTTTGTTTGTAEGVAGPHSSRIANAMDPRVDSDLDGSNRVGAGAAAAGAAPATGTHNYGHHHNPHHAVGTTGNTYGSGAAAPTGTAEGVYGPHSSRLANTLDPRVDSDRDGSVRAGGPTTDTGYVPGGTGATMGTAAGPTTTAASGLGPHKSSLLNKLDPRVDSTTGTVKTSGTTGSTGAYGGTGNYVGSTGSTNAGPHDSNLANKLDPRVDSDLDGSNRIGASYATAGRGTAQNTAGPHNSDLMNKLDPRVDSDQDGSTAMGANRTYV